MRGRRASVLRLNPPSGAVDVRSAVDAVNAVVFILAVFAGQLLGSDGG